MIFEALSPGKRGARRQCVGAGNKSAFFTWDRYTGELLWRVMLTSPTGPWWNSTAVAYNKVYLVSNQRVTDPDSTDRSESVTAALHAYTGEIVWWRHNDSMNRAPVCVANGVFYQSLGKRKFGGLRCGSRQTALAIGYPQYFSRGHRDRQREPVHRQW